jgi:hypothetical protein
MKKIIINDNREKFDPNNCIAIPNDLVDKYMPLFNRKALLAVIDLIKQSYEVGLELGRSEECEHCKKIYD